MLRGTWCPLNVEISLNMLTSLPDYCRPMLQVLQCVQRVAGQERGCSEGVCRGIQAVLPQRGGHPGLTPHGARQSAPVGRVQRQDGRGRVGGAPTGCELHLSRITGVVPEGELLRLAGNVQAGADRCSGTGTPSPSRQHTR